MTRQQMPVRLAPLKFHKTVIKRQCARHVVERRVRILPLAAASLAIVTGVLCVADLVGLAVTTNASIDFVRKPETDADLVSDCRLLKLGRSLAVGDALIRSVGSENVVARASLTYSIPPNREGGA